MAITLAVSGTHSTGKTTLLDSVTAVLHANGHSVKRVRDIAMEAKKQGFPILRDHTFSSTLWIMARGIALELQAGLKADFVLVDRPVVDALGYLIAALEYRHEDLSARHMSYLRSIVGNHVHQYNYIFKTQIDPSKVIDTDKPRDVDPAFRMSAAQGIDHDFSE